MNRWPAFEIWLVEATAYTGHFHLSGWNGGELVKELGLTLEEETLQVQSYKRNSIFIS